jgi:diaminohydroxyphosphoribosylaminopyrimidine deaminase/5-amino-6-(5-phosphoribosylamino)uracil reductase
MSDIQFMRLALRLARRGYGATSPNPMVGAVLVKGTQVIGRGWHRRAGLPHAEIEALQDAQRRGHLVKGATLYVTLEPCSTHGRTPPCTAAIAAAGIKRVVAGAADPNPKHAGRGFEILRRAGVKIDWWGKASPSAGAMQKLAAECTRLNEAFNHWIIRRTPLVTVKAAMTMDGKIATATGESKWITGEKARAFGMKLRQGHDAILVGVNTILADDPSLTFRSAGRKGSTHILHRIILDSLARTPLTAKVIRDESAVLTTIITSRRAPQKHVQALARHVKVLVAPLARSKANESAAIDLTWLLRQLGSESVTSLLVEGGSEVNASFLLEGLAQRVAFFYAPKILGGREARRSVAGKGAESLDEVIQLHEVVWRKLGEDLLLTAVVKTG